MPPIPELPVWVQIIGAMLTGGAVTKLIDRFWLSKKEETDAARDLREELRKALELTNDRMDRLQRDVDEWRGKYFTLLEDHIRLRAEMDLINPKPALYTRVLAEPHAQHTAQ